MSADKSTRVNLQKGSCCFEILESSTKAMSDRGSLCDAGAHIEGENVKNMILIVNGHSVTFDN